MSGYESDSSNDDFQETNVLLGYASKEAEDDVVSRLGGQPDWLDSDAPPTAAFARCKVCKSMMVLLLQLNGELPDQFPNHERRLYVFSCRNVSCRRKEGSIRAIRGTRLWKEDEAKKPKEEQKREETQPEKKSDAPALGNALFGGSAGANPFASNANPFSTSASGASNANPFSTSLAPTNPFSAAPEKSKVEEIVEEVEDKLPKTFAETLNLNNTQETQPPPPMEAWPVEGLPHPYPTLYLTDADYETLEPEKKEVPENARMESADAAEPSGLDKEAFESSMDATFQKFADRMEQNPEQVIRYERGGQPLLYSKLDAVGAKLTKSTMPGCPNCGSRRTFEVQMTPHAITELEADDMSLDGMEWGTIIVGACEKDCVPNDTELGRAGYVEEYAGVQWEELAKNN